MDAKSVNVQHGRMILVMLECGAGTLNTEES
jgi:hypothetical protein